MNNSFGKYEKHRLQGIHCVKGGAQLAAKSVTTTTATIERGNDLDSARHIENKTSIDSTVIS